VKARIADSGRDLLELAK